MRTTQLLTFTVILIAGASMSAGRVRAAPAATGAPAADPQPASPDDRAAPVDPQGDAAPEQDPAPPAGDTIEVPSESPTEAPSEERSNSAQPPEPPPAEAERSQSVPAESERSAGPDEPAPLQTGPAKATDQTTSAATEDAPAPWVPEIETKRMARHPLDPSKSAFRPGKGLSFVSRDNMFALAIGLRGQLLYTLEYDGEANEASHGLQIRRARVKFGGHMFGEHNEYKMELALSPRDEAFDGNTVHRTPLLDWYLDFTHLRDLSVRFGQYKVPFSRQRVVSSGSLQMVDRALANGEFNLDRSIGLDLRSEDFLGLDKLRYYLGIYTGEGRDQFEVDEFELMYLARFEVLPLGMFDDYAEGDFARIKRPRLAIAAAYAFVDGAQADQGILGSTPSDGGTTDYHNVAADFVLHVLGLSVTGEFFWRRGFRKFGNATIEDDAGNTIPAPRDPARNGLGWFAQAGFMIPRVPVELVARYGQIRKLGQTSLADADEVGGGINYYIGRHAMKLQLDYFHGWTAGDIRDGTDTIRLQLEAGF
jgi:hypothetical protein